MAFCRKYPMPTKSVNFLKMLMAVAISCLASLVCAHPAATNLVPSREPGLLYAQATMKPSSRALTSSLEMPQNPHFGPKITESMTTLTRLQREWWKLLSDDPSLQAPALPVFLENSRIFDSSCRAPQRRGDLAALSEGVAAIISSSSRGALGYTIRGRFLQCLELSGMGITAARIEVSFLKSLKSEFGEPLMSCKLRPASRGEQTVIIPKVLRNIEGKLSVNRYGSENNYANVVFQRLLLNLVYNENIVHAAQACCGSVSSDRIGACAALDKAGQSEITYVELAKRVDTATAPMIAQLEGDFGAQNANNVLRAYLTRLAGSTVYSAPGSVYQGKVVDDLTYRSCVQSHGGERCEQSLAIAIRDISTKFFREECPEVVSGEFESACATFSARVQSWTAVEIAKVLSQSK